MDIHCYVVQHDKGFAPNPFWGFCTLACCKPRTRAKASLGDTIIGFASADQKIKLGGRVIYWMKVDEIITFDEYWRRPQFAPKRPELGGSLAACYGDNIYHQKKGVWEQASSFHSDGEELGKGNLERDTSTTDRVLIARDFTYWGKKAPLFPSALGGLVPKSREERCRYSVEDKKNILKWIDTSEERGYQAEPVDWSREHSNAETSGRTLC